MEQHCTFTMAIHRKMYRTVAPALRFVSYRQILANAHSVCPYKSFRLTFDTKPKDFFFNFNKETGLKTDMV